MRHDLRGGIALFTLLLACGGGGPAAAPPAPAPAPVRTLRVTPQAFDEEEVAVGVIVAPDSVELRPEVAGLVRSVNFTDGQSVGKGAALVRLYDGDAQAALVDANARGTLARLNLDRTRALLERQDVSQAELDRVAAEDALARAAVLRASEAVRKTVIVAPFEGVMGRRDVAPGQMVDPSRVVGRIEDLRQLVVDLSLPEKALGRVAVGQVAQVAVEALGLTAPGEVIFVSPRVREDSRTVDLRVKLTDPDPRLRPGLSVGVRVVVGRQEAALLVPTEAVVMAGERASVWVLGPEGTVSLRPIQPGPRGPNQLVVREGIAAGDAVVIEGLARLKPGAPVAEKVDAPAPGGSAK